MKLSSALNAGLFLAVVLGFIASAQPATITTFDAQVQAQASAKVLLALASTQQERSPDITWMHVLFIMVSCGLPMEPSLS
jgi:hypothetical protein